MNLYDKIIDIFVQKIQERFKPSAHREKLSRKRMYKEKIEICLMDRDAIKREREREKSSSLQR